MIAGSFTSSDSDTYTVEAGDLTFNALLLVTPLPEPLEDECDGSAGEDSGESAGDEDESGESAVDEDESAGGEDESGSMRRAAIPGLGLLSAFALGLGM